MQITEGADLIVKDSAVGPARVSFGASRYHHLTAKEREDETRKDEFTTSSSASSLHFFYWC